MFQPHCCCQFQQFLSIDNATLSVLDYQMLLFAITVYVVSIESPNHLGNSIAHKFCLFYLIVNEFGLWRTSI
jgi:hypothetical protein